jgi:hypothetical protein
LFLKPYTQTFYQSAMQAQAMCLGIDLSRSCVFEHRPNSRPERCKNNYLYIHLCEFCSLRQHSKFKYVFYSCKFQNTWTSVKTTQYNSLGSPTFPNYSTNKNRMQSFVTWPAGSKQKPQELSNAGFFYQGKVSKHKSLFITENISSKPKLMYKWFICYRKKWSYYLLPLRSFS